MKLLSYMAVAVMGFSVVAWGDTSVSTTEVAPKNFVYGNFYYQFENRDKVSVQNPQFFLGYDRLVHTEAQVYVGGRLGFSVEQTLTSIPVGPAQTKAFFGVHGFKLFNLTDVVKLKTGAAVDILQGDTINPLYLYLGGELGVRYHITPCVYAEVPIEVGFFPAFTGLPVFGKIGLQVGLGF